MLASPRLSSFEFFKTHPNATKEQAIQYANQELPHSPLTIAEFMAEWESLRERYLEAIHYHGDLI